jgi:hypothetical protein
MVDFVPPQKFSELLGQSTAMVESCNFIGAAQQDATHFAGPDRCVAIRACYAKATHAR